jgi:glycosyltransferase involved in cell wall biosynthesis
VLADVADSYEVIVVDDGGRDRTGEIADRLAAGDPRIRVVHHPDNLGYGAALRSGFAAAQYPLVVLVDGGNQFDLGELAILLRRLDRGDIVTGYRIAQHDPLIRRVYAFMYNRLARVLFHIPVRDVNCGFKIYRRHLVERLLPQLRSSGALINVEMLARARKLGADVTEAGVHHFPREAGDPTAAHPFRTMRELLELWRELR